MKKIISKGKNKDKGQSFDRYKVQMDLICDVCNSRLFVYSNKMVGVKGVLKQYDVDGTQ